jgi:hypothetical protein
MGLGCCWFSRPLGLIHVVFYIIPQPFYGWSKKIFFCRKMTTCFRTLAGFLLLGAESIALFGKELVVT